MSKIVAIHQPETFPYAGYLNKMMSADVFIILDDVQFKKNNFQNRNRIYRGKSEWLTIPVDLKCRLDSTIQYTKISYNVDWKSRVLHQIELAYNRSPYYESIMGNLRPIIEGAGDSIFDFNMDVIYFFRDYLGINTPLIQSSTLGTESHKSDLVLEICETVGATTYLSGAGGAGYLNEQRFREKGIKVLYQKFDNSIEYRV